MPQGIQAWDEKGVMTLDVTDRLTRIVGIVTASPTSPKSGSVSIPAESYGGNQVFAQIISTAVIPQGAAYSSLVINGATITYSNLTSNMIYGVF